MYYVKNTRLLLEGLDILLTDASCTEEILNIARSQGATVVSSEWIIQVS